MSENYVETQLEDSSLLNYIYNLGRTVRFMATIDMFFAFLYVLSNPYYLIYSLINLIFSYCGYSGSKYYNLSYIFCYLIYNFLKIFGNIAVVIATIQNNNLNNNIVTFSFFSGFIILVNIYLISIVCKFYNQVKNLPDHLSEELKRGPQVIHFVYW